MLRAAEPLIRSGALALVVLDAVGLPFGGVLSPLFRLSRQALRHGADDRAGTAVVLLTEVRRGTTSSLGSCIALRLCIERRAYCFDPGPRPPFDLTGYRIEVQLGKVKFPEPTPSCEDGSSSELVGRRASPWKGAVDRPCVVDVVHREGVVG